jgi:SsrA-binding protein
MSKASAKGELQVCSNPKALQNYEIEERLEVGIVLTGPEVKSLRAKKGSLEAAYASVDQGQLTLHGMHIGPYEQAGHFGHELRRSRRLLAHRREIERWTGHLAHKGYTAVPMRVYFKDGRAKVELGLGKGKKHGDNRESIKRDLDLREARDAIARIKR